MTNFKVKQISVKSRNESILITTTDNKEARNYFDGLEQSESSIFELQEFSGKVIIHSYFK